MTLTEYGLVIIAFVVGFCAACIAFVFLQCRKPKDPFQKQFKPTYLKANRHV
jgi:hypothetical protein